MMKFHLLTIFIVFNFFECGYSYSFPQLKLVSVLFRHGDRQPNDEINGDLTNVGRRRAHNLGGMLRAKYGDFLGDIYEPAAVSARSTEYSRAKMSLQLLLAALYVPQGYQRWHDSLAWQPIPFSYARENDDVLLFPKFCPRFKREMEKNEALPEYQKLLDPYRSMLNNLSIVIGKEMKTSNDMFLLYHNLASMQSMNKSLPSWADNIFPDGALLSGTYLAYDVLKYSDWMRKINGGTLIRKIADDMLNKTDDDWTSKRKLFLYSAHELNIVSVLQTLKVWQPHVPEYSSAIIVELREDRKNHYVQVLYYMGTPSIFKVMQIPGCLDLCPLTKFIELISDQLPAYDEIICDNKLVALSETSAV